MATDPNTHLRNASDQLRLAAALLGRNTMTRRRLEELIREVDELTTPRM